MIRQDFRPNYIRAVRTPPGSVGGAPGDPGGGGGGGVGENRVIGNNALHVLVNELERDYRRENADKKRKLSIGSSHHSKIDGILIICKNFKFYKYADYLMECKRNSSLGQKRPCRANQ